ncbi:hypothetical protein BJI49_07590 [Acetobacter pasteurianus]|uniref:Uncharacterized protein n=1 Tax=Acetobacter pasteurianus TaxID=438 RepID=A0A1A0DGV6_ACEPA|nr:hypothetical protein [Acetobacter pasteurianus]OAZ73917.1 hypothetical protein SRCM100623_00746 [Acetobacter pasteurianus]RCL07146.1 hypothetical protein BJI49_07590 [Acetobacter pasteurianus]
MTTLLDFSAGVATGAGGNTLSGGQIVDAVTSGTSILTKLNPGASCDLPFAKRGNIGYRILPDQDCALSVSGGNVGELQTMHILIQQPFSGNCEITWPDNVIWPSGAPFVDSRIGAVCCVEIMWDGASRYYGRLIFG